MSLLKLTNTLKALHCPIRLIQKAQDIYDDTIFEYDVQKACAHWQHHQERVIVAHRLGIHLSLDNTPADKRNVLAIVTDVLKNANYDKYGMGHMTATDVAIWSIQMWAMLDTFPQYLMMEYQNKQLDECFSVHTH